MADEFPIITTTICIPCYPPVGDIPINPEISPPTTQLPLGGISIFTTTPPDVQVLNDRKILVIDTTPPPTTISPINTTSTTTNNPQAIVCPDVSWIGKLNF